jgi:hypothetical protein
MEQINPPSTRSDLLPEAVSHLEFKRDAGTAWARALSPTQVADLVDLAGNLATVFPVVKERRVTEKQFNNKLDKMGIRGEADQQVQRIVGWTSGMVTPYVVWWCWCWVYNYTRCCSGSDTNEAEARADTASRMGITLDKANHLLCRRDVSYLVNLFLVRMAREMEGEIKWQTAIGAMNGVSKAQDLFFRHVASSADIGERSGTIDPWNKSESELMQEIAKMRKEIGEELNAEDAEFEVNLGE